MKKTRKNFLPNIGRVKIKIIISLKKLYMIQADKQVKKINPENFTSVGIKVEIQ